MLRTLARHAGRIIGLCQITDRSHARKRASVIVASRRTRVTHSRDSRLSFTQIYHQDQRSECDRARYRLPRPRRRRCRRPRHFALNPTRADKSASAGKRDFIAGLSDAPSLLTRVFLARVALGSSILPRPDTLVIRRYGGAPGWRRRWW